MSRLFARVLGSRRSGALDYERAKALIQREDVAQRRRVAASHDVAPEILFYLASDTAPEVRREIASNGGAPPHADLLLARDADGDVRCQIARKVGRLAPGLSEEARERAGALILETLEVLARDALPRVRAILADELKHATGVPAPLIERLARDGDATVAAPVLEFSPLLAEDFLVELIRGGAAGAQLAAIARRDALGAAASDAIVARDDTNAIAQLLENRSAQVREETLDALVARAAPVAEWHAPLVRRPALSQSAIRRLSEFVADSLIETLANRADLMPATAEIVRARVRERLGQQAAGTFSDDATLIARAQALAADGALDGSSILHALGAGERPFAMAQLAVLAGLPLGAVEKAVSLKSAKGVVAIAWKAGLGTEHATQLQLRLARIAPSAALGPGPGGRFPLGEDEMRWQLDYFTG
jgi:uncharacterized protein (DUF2336 family)